MKSLLCLCLSGFAMLSFESNGAVADLNPFAEGHFLNPATNLPAGDAMPYSSVSVWSGGNVGPYPDPNGRTPEAVTRLGGVPDIRLVQSAFGQVVAGPLGYPTAVADLNEAGLDSLRRSSAYATFTTLTGNLEKRAESWDIRFPGVINEKDGTVFGAAGQNYFEEANRVAERSYRAALRIDPLNADAAEGLLVCYHHRMLPLIHAGNAALVRSGRERLNNINPLLGEIAVLETNGLAFYERAAGEVIQLANTQPEAGLLDSTYPHSAVVETPGLVAIKGKVLNSYARALALQAETLLKLVRLKYLAGYDEPNIGGDDIRGILALVDGKLARLEDQLLLANAFAGLPIIQIPELIKARQLMGELRRLRDSMANGRLSFVGSGVDRSSGVSSFSYHEYAANYVPFFHDVSLPDAQSPSSFANLLARAKELAGWSDTMDGRAKSVDRQFDLDKFSHDSALRSVRDRYYQELGNLCGWIRADPNELVPDIGSALLPAGERDRRHAYTGPGEAKGAIYTQWRRIAIAETELSAANQDIQNVLASMRKKQEIADQIAVGQANIAHLILANGDRIAVLDREEGEARAAAVRTSARLRGQSSIASGILSSVSSGVSLGVAAGDPWVGLGVGLFAAFGQYQQINAIFEVGKVEANLANRTAEIQAQKTRIAATQSAEIQFQQIDNDRLRTEEAMFALVLESERLKLNLLMAEQKLDMENLELANMTARVQFLLQEYVSALALEQSNPLASPDYRLIRDLTLRDAEETFVHAQEWAFLAARAAQYRANNSGARGVQFANLLSSLLAERTGQGLRSGLDRLQSAYDQFVSDLGGAQREFATLSLRHDVVQNNVVQENASGNIDPSRSSLELAPDGLSSNADWLRYLQSNITTNAQGSRRLTLTFSTSLLRRVRDGRNANPLYHPTLYNALLFYHESLAEAHGVRINLKGGRAIGNIPSDRPVRVHLRQAGASYIRNQAATGDPNGAGIQVWDLNRVRRWNQSDALGVLEQSEIEHLPETSIIFASLDGFTERRGGERLHELSPANDRWILTVFEDITDNQPLFLQLDKLVDIEIRFSLWGF